PSIRARYRAAAVLADTQAYLVPFVDVAKQAPARPDDPELKKILEVLQELQKTRPDSKELRDLIERLKAWKATTPVHTKETVLNLHEKTLSPPQGYFKMAEFLQQSPYAETVVQAQPQKGQIDWKRLVTLLEQIQKAPDKVDPKEISKVLE